jgi:peptidoglycan/xylan/chitin deacetylase (PgdA/CDA1 family)
MLKNDLKMVMRAAKRFVVKKIDEPALILMYHRVAELLDDPFGLAVSPDNFLKQIEFLKASYNVIDANELCERRKTGKSLPKKSIIITFDDGYLDNYTTALPVLEHFDAATIFFIATANIGRKNEFWSDALGWVLYETEVLPAFLAVCVNGQEYGFNTLTSLDRSEAYKKLHTILKQTNPVYREEALGFILDWAGLPQSGRDTHRFMGSADVANLAASSVATIGAHTHNHPQLSSLSRDDQYGEILQSLEVLRSLTGRSIKHFSYPYGSISEYDCNSIEICKSLGVDLAYGGWGVLYRWSDNYQLPRINVGNWDVDTFTAKLAQLI